MSNGTKIKTMKDDLLEIENKVSQSMKIPEKQQKSATLSSGTSSVLPGQKPSAGFPLPKNDSEGHDLKTKELRNIVDRLSKNKSGVVPPSSQKTAAPSYIPDIKTSTSEATELKALIDRISKREGEREKPLTASEDKEKEIVPDTEPQKEPAIAAKIALPAVKPSVIPKQEPEKIIEPLKTPIADKTPFEKPDLNTLIKPVSRPTPASEEKKPETAPEKMISAKNIMEKAIPAEQPAPQANGRALEEKITETKEVLESITKKENELKELLEKMSRNKRSDTVITDSEVKAIPQAPARTSAVPSMQAKKTAAPAATTYLDKLIKPAEKPSLKSLGIKETLVTSPEQKTVPIKNTGSGEEKPIMKKIRERLFGLEKEISQAKPVTETAPVQTAKNDKEAMQVPAENRKTEEKNTSAATPAKKTDAKDYFKKISEDKTLSAAKIESVEEKFSNLPQEKQSSIIKPEKINEFENTSGVIKSSSKSDLKKEDELTKARRNYLDSQYVSPTSRLVFGKQEHYSSIRKHIEERHLDANLKDLESRVAVAKNIVISEKEEKKRLRERIMSKYHIRSSPFLRNILILAVLVIVIGGAALYGYLSKIEVKPPDIIVPVITGNELKELSQIKDSLEITAEKLKNPTALRDEAGKKFASDPNLKLFRLIIKNDKGDIVDLKNALGGIGFNVPALPQNFMGATENDYSLIISKTSKLTMRFAIAIRLKSPESMQTTMNSWEKDRIKMKDGLNPLFISDRTSDIQNSYFQAGSYKNISIRYVSLPDKDSAIDYFIHKNILVIATTKDDTFKFIDILTSVQ
ncbi:MAG: hypothetical protein WC788_06325 [Candidatus Paceibacterota bacterium]|jgi:hypothetical protein